MTQIETFTAVAIQTPMLKSALKAASTDEEFVEIFVSEARTKGFHISENEVWSQMQADRKLAETMSNEDFEDVAGSMIGARLSGGHQSGGSC